MSGVGKVVRNCRGSVFLGMYLVVSIRGCRLGAPCARYALLPVSVLVLCLASFGSSASDLGA